jgi:hypothetical protein
MSYCLFCRSRTNAIWLDASLLILSSLSDNVTTYSVWVHGCCFGGSPSLLFKNICEIFRIDKTQTTAFHPQSDGLVERFNRTIKDMLSKAVRRDQRNWDDILPLLMPSEHKGIG